MKSRPLFIDMQQSRLCLHGLCFCMHTNAQAQMALTASVITNLKGRRGRPPKCLLSTLRADKDKAAINMQTMKGFKGLQKHAADKHQWGETIEYISSEWIDH